MSKASGKNTGKNKLQAKASAKKAAPGKAVGKPVKTAAPKSPAKSAPVTKNKSQTSKPTAKKPPLHTSKTAHPPKAQASTLHASKVQSLNPAAAAARTIATAERPAPKKTESIAKKMVARAKVADIVLPPDYRPTDDEPFMNEMHRAYFRKRLLDWKDDILRQTRETLTILHEDSTQHADIADRATSETDRATELRTRDRQRKLIAKIDAAVGRIDDGSYGYCEDTGEPIGLKRLDARPIATLSVEAQERHERREKVYREE